MSASEAKGDNATPVPGRTGVLGFLADATSEETTRTALATVLGGDFELRRGSVRDAVRHLERGPSPLLLIVDITGIDHYAAALEALALVCAPDVKVLVVGDRNDAGIYRTLVRDLGVDEYLYKPLNLETVVRVLRPMLGKDRPETRGPRGGKVVAVVGARGGVGASTIVTELGRHLAGKAHHHTVMLDLNLQSSEIALMLGLQADAGLRAAFEKPDRLDTLFLERTALRVADRLDLLAAEETVDAELRADPDAPDDLIDLLRQRYNLVIVDVPAFPTPLHLRFLALANVRIVVLEPTLSGCRGLLRYRALAAGKAETRPPIYVLNKQGLPGGLSSRDLQKALDLEPECVLPFLPKTVVQAANAGRSVAERSTPFRRGIERLAHEIAAGTGSVRPKRLGGGLFGRLRLTRAIGG
ncbi:AAA family ATPase [Marinimicrococcus flavescens]|uniref:Cellulose synthase operon protein YhjQ/BcsQ n=1 Tax=Marinimicrococcus flavescens TaxID=3031815 RepID=A0AAP3V0Z6_9PROT|nr:cellulose synthase operon protein YhjQ/BcsQ [Marinimicrococcus flavescens]